MNERFVYTNLSPEGKPSNEIYKRKEEAEQIEIDIPLDANLKQDLKEIYGDDQDAKITMISGRHEYGAKTFKLTVGEKTDYIVGDQIYGQKRSPREIFAEALKNEKDRLKEQNDLADKGNEILKNFPQNSESKAFFEKKIFLLGALSKYFPNISNIEFSISANDWRNKFEDSSQEGSLFKIEKGEIAIYYKDDFGKNKKLIYKSNLRISNTKTNGDKDSMYTTLVTNLLENRKNQKKVESQKAYAEKNPENSIKSLATESAKSVLDKLAKKPYPYRILSAYLNPRLNNISEIDAKKTESSSKFEFVVSFKNGKTKKVEMLNDIIKIV